MTALKNLAKNIKSSKWWKNNILLLPDTVGGELKQPAGKAWAMGNFNLQFIPMPDSREVGGKNDFKHRFSMEDSPVSSWSS